VRFSFINASTYLKITSPETTVAPALPLDDFADLPGLLGNTPADMSKRADAVNPSKGKSRQLPAPDLNVRLCSYF
jgi:hypothetical protein